MRDKHFAEQVARLDDKHLDRLASTSVAPRGIRLTLNGVPQHRLTLNGLPLTQLTWRGQHIDRRRSAAVTTLSVRLRRRDDVDLGVCSDQAPATPRPFDSGQTSGLSTPSTSALAQLERAHANA